MNRPEKKIEIITLPLGLRLIGWMLLAAQAFVSMPVLAATSTMTTTGSSMPVVRGKSNGPVAVLTPKNVKARKGSREVGLIQPKLAFSDNPTDLEIKASRVFGEPLIPMSGRPVDGENKAISQALLDFKAGGDSENIGALTGFIKQYPQSRWRASLELDLGILRYQTGYLSEALSYWQSSWEHSQQESGKEQSAVADRAIGEFLVLNAKLGRMDQLKKYFEQIKGRKISAAAAQKVVSAQEGWDTMKRRPQTSFKCGPYAVNSILQWRKRGRGREQLIEDAPSTTQGTSLSQVKGWADQVGLHYQMAKRDPGSSFIVPSVLHWKVNHFAAILDYKDNKYLIKDSTFGRGELWISAQALEAESDGYFLVANGKLPTGWQSLGNEDGKKVWGKGQLSFRDYAILMLKIQPCPCQYSKGMARASVYPAQATLNLEDTPIGYDPPVGPAINFTVNYNYLQATQPGNYTFSNLSPEWNLNWLSYVTVDASYNLQVVLGGGSVENYDYSALDNVNNVYPPNPYSQAVVSIISPGQEYRRQLPDGTVQVFNQPDGTGRIFMTKLIDPQGNAAVIHYDSNFRITSIVDAIGQESMISYMSDTFGDPGFYLITQITDPFGRMAAFGYDDTKSCLVKITDEIGLVSQFNYQPGTSAATYDRHNNLYNVAGNFVYSLTTPYGTTQFTPYLPLGSTANSAGISGLVFTFPDGSSAVLANDPGAMATYYWDRKAMSLYPTDYSSQDYTHCQTTKWMLDGVANTEEPVMQSQQLPLEGAVNYTYPDQPAGVILQGDTGTQYIMGSINKPVSISRTLDDSSMQTYQYQYNALGYPTQTIDPLGRTFSYAYAPNGIDLLEARQTQGGNTDLLGKWQYNSQHRPILHIDTSGQQTHYTYNSAGQLVSVTDPKGNVTTLTYDSNGYLTQIDGPLSGSNDVMTFTYDGLGRTRTVTDSEAYTLTYDYDNLDRVTKITYPDGTYQQITYDRLDAVLLRDRLGRWTSRSYDSMGQLSQETDPLGRITNYAWCTCGALAELTDANGNSTMWERDLQGRVTQKDYQDGTSVVYTYENSTSRLKSVTDALGQIKNYTYNQDNSLAQISYTNAVNPTSTVNYTYDMNYPRLTSAQNGWGTVSYSYNAYVTDPYATPVTGAGKLQQESNNVLSGAEVAYTYDELGRVTGRSVGGTSDSSWTYDAMGRVTALTNALGTFGYTYVDANKGTLRLSSVSYPNGQATNYSYYDNNGDQRLQQIQNLNPSSTVISQFTYAYNPAGEITQWTRQVDSGNPQRYDLGYDAASQLTGAVDNDTVSGTVTNRQYYTYDPAGNRTGNQSNDVTLHYSYNNVNQLTNTLGGGPVHFQGSISKAGSVTINGAPATMQTGTSFTANVTLPVGNNTVTVEATDGSGNTGTNNYQVTVGNPGNMRLSYFNFENSNLQGDRGQLPVAVRGISQVSSSDGQGVLVTSSNSSLLAYHVAEADGSSNINVNQGSISLNFKPNWSSSSLGGTGPGITLSQLFQVGTTTGDKFSLGMTGGGNYLSGNMSVSGTVRQMVVAPINFQQGQTYNITYTWGNDATALYVSGTLLATGTSVSPVPQINSSATMSIGMDLSGSVQTNGVLDDVQIFNYELSAATIAGQSAPANTKPAYDANGNLTADGNGTSYAWDAENRLIKITYASGATSNFIYDPLGRRVSIVEKDGGGSTTSTKNLLWTGQQIIQEQDSSYNVTKRYYALGMQTVSGATTTNYYYTKDHLGSIREMVDNTGTLQTRYDYDVYGNATKVSGSIDSDFQYARYYYHSPSKLNFTLYRAYDAKTARWLSKDPIEENGGINLYRYVGNNSISKFDWLGLQERENDDADIEEDLGLEMEMNGARITLDEISNEFKELEETISNAFNLKVVGKCDQLEFNFGESMPWEIGQSGLVIGRGADLSQDGALRPGEYRLSWFSIQDSNGMEAEWGINEELLQNIIDLGLSIRDASSIEDREGYYLNAERALIQVQQQPWQYQSGFWSPSSPTK